MTIGCIQAIEVMLTVLARPHANILLPSPGFPYDEASAAFSCLEVRHFDLLPEKGWEVDDAVEALADEDTVAMVIINPGNPCGNVFTYKHLNKIVDCVKGFLNISSDPATFIQGAVPQILENTRDDFFSKIVNILREAADVCYDRIKEIPCITCPSKPEGSMFVMMKLNLSLLEDIKDDIDFCAKLAKEESMVVLPGVAVGLKNWLLITFAIERSSLEKGLGRIKAFYLRHSKNH